MIEKIKIKFPDNFLWGAGTSAHQVEGYARNDWSEWEIENCRRLASKAKSVNASSGSPGIAPPSASEIKRLSEDPNNYVSGQACDHYKLFCQDFDLAKALHHNVHRFSIEWSRIEPTEGCFNKEAIEHYREVIAALKERGIEPFVTLWHYTIPIWFRDKGGWKARNATAYYSRYVETIINSYRDDVRYWVTLNEPMVYAKSSYLTGSFPPQEKNAISFYRVVKELIKAHNSAYQLIKESSSQAQVGIAQSIVYFEAYQNRLANIFLKKGLDWFWNFSFLDGISDFQDFVGINYYFHKVINYGLHNAKDGIISDMGWELYPDGLHHALRDVTKYRKPIYITENGLADADDKNRAGYIKEILKNIARALEEGIDVRGYLYWSLLDNFEWDKGFWPRFGLVKVNYETLEREVRDSALEFAEIIKNLSSQSSACRDNRENKA